MHDIPILQYSRYIQLNPGFIAVHFEYQVMSTDQHTVVCFKGQYYPSCEVTLEDAHSSSASFIALLREIDIMVNTACSVHNGRII